MANVVLQRELHANVRRTRITYSALIDSQPAAIKCFRKPLFGLFHWQRARIKAHKIRNAGGPVPPVLYAGWVRELRCFGFATEFLEGYRSLREALRESAGLEEQKQLLEKLAECIADLHQRGIEQPDGNLTNFLLGPSGDIKMVDEDDVRVFKVALTGRVAMLNLANVGARLPSGELPLYLRKAYVQARKDLQGEVEFDEGGFDHEVFRQKEQFRIKREARDAAPDREYD